MTRLYRDAAAVRRINNALACVGLRRDHATDKTGMQLASVGGLKRSRDDGAADEHLSESQLRHGRAGDR